MAVVAGTAKDVEKAAALMSAAFTVATIVPLKMIEMSSCAGQLVPDTVTVPPPDAHVGDTVIAGGGAAARGA